MIRLMCLTTILAFLYSCNASNSVETRLKSNIENRISKLNEMFRFEAQPLTWKYKQFDTLKYAVNGIVKSNIDRNIAKNEIVVSNIFRKYGVEYSSNNKTKEDVMLSIFEGLDALIFKYGHINIDSLNYKAIVVPDKYNVKMNETVGLKIYLALNDTLFYPEFKFKFEDKKTKEINESPLIVENGGGEIGFVSKLKGLKELKGFILYQNNKNVKDTIYWCYKYEVK